MTLFRIHVGQYQCPENDDLISRNHPLKEWNVIKQAYELECSLERSIFGRPDLHCQGKEKTTNDLAALQYWGRESSNRLIDFSFAVAMYDLLKCNREKTGITILSHCGSGRCTQLLQNHILLTNRLCHCWSSIQSIRNMGLSKACTFAPRSLGDCLFVD
jgi:hypothetical protein